jgi:DNA-binding CsgD family transcriptional regulator
MPGRRPGPDGGALPEAVQALKTSGARGAAPAQPAPAVRLLGRGNEREALDGVLRGAREGRSGTLVARGEPGIGKSALLGYAARSAAGFQVARWCGVEAERELSFAALQQLCGPAEGRIADLPGPQADALDVAFGLRRGTAPDRFLVGLAVLTLLSALAEEQPVLWIVDDAQWLDQASAQVLGFVARRLQVDPVALLFGARAGVGLPALAGLPALEVGGLSDGDARALLAESLTRPLDPAVADRIIAEAHGNPLALMELPRASTAAELAGGFGIPRTGLVSGRLEDSFRRRVAALPEDSRLLLLLAAAEPLGDPELLRAASGRLGLSEKARDEAEAEGLIRLGERVVFRHPLVRSAVYHAAPGEDRRLVHRALAEVTDRQADPDRWAWHRAESAAGADEDIAADLERSAQRAHARGGLAAEAAFGERAMSLTPDRGRRAVRALAAATAKLAAGEPDRARGLMKIARQGPLGPPDRARLDLLEARAVLLLTQSLDGAPELFLHAARQLAPFDAAVSRETYLQAIQEAIHAGRLGSIDGLRNTARAARAAPEATQPPRPVDLLLDGMVTRFTTGGAAATRALDKALAAFREQADGQVPHVAMLTAIALWDDETWGMIVEGGVQLARRTGNLAGLLLISRDLIGLETLRGHFDTAGRVNQEAAGIRAAIGAAPAPTGAVILAGWRGREEETLALTRSAVPVMTAYGSGLALVVIDYATAIQYNALGRYDMALAAARTCVDTEVPADAQWVLPEAIEAAVRTRDLLLAAKALERLAAAGAAAGHEWGLGVMARCRALMTSDAGQAEGLYREAIGRLGQTSIAVDLARAHLVYGEWLRRERRRGDAREQLRTAYGMFAAMGAEAFADRAARELRAAGEHPRKHSADTRAQLTPQQAQIAQLASAGHSNPEISAQLFISRRTVEYHLQNVFTKLGVTSRTQLPRAGLLAQGDANPRPCIPGRAA